LNNKDLNANVEVNVIKMFFFLDYLKENGNTLRYIMNDKDS
jgi:hypothetical protein